MSNIPMVVPPHTCEGEDCPHPRAMAFIAIDDGNGGVDTSTSVHNLSVATAAETFIKMWDNLMMDGDHDIPSPIRFARGREELRRAIERSDPPEEVVKALSAFMDGDD